VPCRHRLPRRALPATTRSVPDVGSHAERGNQQHPANEKTHTHYKDGIMITLRTRTDIKDDRRVVLNLPPEVPVGQAELVVTIEPQAPDNKPARTSLAAWADVNAKSWGDQLKSQDVVVLTGWRLHLCLVAPSCWILAS